MCYMFFFFKQKTAYEMRISDWSSDVCSSDLDGRRRHFQLEDALSSFAENAVCDHHGGWENGEGAYGEIVIDVASGGVTITHNARFIDYDTTETELSSMSPCYFHPPSPARPRGGVPAPHTPLHPRSDESPNTTPTTAQPTCRAKGATDAQTP